VPIDWYVWDNPNDDSNDMSVVYDSPLDSDSGVDWIKHPAFACSATGNQQCRAYGKFLVPLGYAAVTNFSLYSQHYQRTNDPTVYLMSIKGYTNSTQSVTGLVSTAGSAAANNIMSSWAVDKFPN